MSFDEYGDPLVPNPDVLEPETVDRVLERVVGKQISRLVEFADVNPKGGAQVGFELRTHERPLYWAFPVPEPLQAAGYCAVWCPQWFPAQMIVTRSMEGRMTSDRGGESYTPNPLYRRLEGEIIRGAKFLDEANQYGGQTILFELSSRMQLRLLAIPGRAHGLPSRFSANYKLELKLPPKSTVFGPLDGPSIITPTFLGGR